MEILKPILMCAFLGGMVQIRAHHDTEIFIDSASWESGQLDPYCLNNSASRELECNFTNYENVLVKIYQPQDFIAKAIIRQASSAIIYDQCCLQKIVFHNSKSILTVKNFTKSKPFDLYLIDSEAENIISKGIRYLKSESSNIYNLELPNLDEFDILLCNVTKFTASTKKFTPHIYSSRIERLSLNILEESVLTIVASDIEELEKLELNNEKVSTISNTTIRRIKQNGIIVRTGSSIVLEYVKFGILESHSVIIEGLLILRNEIYTYEFNPDWLLVKPGGSVTFSNQSASVEEKFSIIGVNFNLVPLRYFHFHTENSLFKILTACSVAISFTAISLLLVVVFFKRRNKSKQLISTKFHNVSTEDVEIKISEKKEDNNSQKNIYITNLFQDKNQMPNGQLEDYTEVDIKGTLLESYTDVESSTSTKTRMDSPNKSSVRPLPTNGLFQQQFRLPQIASQNKSQDANEEHPSKPTSGHEYKQMMQNSSLLGKTTLASNSVPKIPKPPTKQKPPYSKFPGARPLSPPVNKEAEGRTDQEYDECQNEYEEYEGEP